MSRTPPRSTLTDPLLPSTTLFRSHRKRRARISGGQAPRPRRLDPHPVARAAHPRRGDGQVAALQGSHDPVGELRGAAEGMDDAPLCHGVERPQDAGRKRSEEHTSELQSLMRISYAVFCLKKKKEKHYKTRNT